MHLGIKFKLFGLNNVCNELKSDWLKFWLFFLICTIIGRVPRLDTIILPYYVI